MSGVTILEQQHVFVTLLDFRDGALLHGVIPNLNICTNLGINTQARREGRNNTLQALMSFFWRPFKLFHATSSSDSGLRQ